jgi:hypothetical protein
MGGKYQTATKLLNGNKNTKWTEYTYSKWPQNIPTFFYSKALHNFPKSWIFGLKTSHLANLRHTPKLREGLPDVLFSKQKSKFG